MNLAHAAIEWARLGVPVFPCRMRGKEPATRHGVKDATCDEAQIRAWWSEGPRLNVGGATGMPCGWWVLDADGDLGLRNLEALQELHGALPSTRVHATGGGGRHYFWAMSQAALGLKNRAGKLGAGELGVVVEGRSTGLDVRTTGGFVVLPPSVHESGALYNALCSDAPPEAPQWLVDLALRARKPEAAGQRDLPLDAQREREDVVSRMLGAGAVESGGGDLARLDGIVRAAAERIRHAPVGTRNDTLNRECFGIGGWLEGLGGTVDRVAPELEAAAIAAEQNPAHVRRALEDGARSPRGRPPERDPGPQYTAPNSPEEAPPEPPPIEDAGDLHPGEVAAMVLTRAFESGDHGSIFENTVCLAGVARPGPHAGQVEGALLRLPAAVQRAVRRAAKELRASAPRPTRSAPEPTLPLVVVHGPTWWVLGADLAAYVACPPRLAVTEVERRHPGVNVFTVTKDGDERRLTDVELHREYGTIAAGVRWKYGAERPEWDPRAELLTLPGGRVTPGEVAFDERCDRYLRLLPPEAQVERFLDWLATAGRLELPTAALVIGGTRGTGKGMLASALVAYFGGWVGYDEAVGQFNGALVRNPLVWLDEGVSVDARSAAFRRLLGNRVHRVIAKGRMAEDLEGCPRILVTSNEPDPLQLGMEDLSHESERAIGERIFAFRPRDEAAAYLAELGGQEGTAGWGLADGPLVRHLRWLAETREVEPGENGRWLVSGDSEEWVATSHLRAGIGSDVCAAYRAHQDDRSTREWCGDPQPFFHPPNSDMVACSPKGLQANWATLVGAHDRPPRVQAIGKALRRLAGGAGPTRVGGEKERGPRVFMVPRAVLEGGGEDGW